MAHPAYTISEEIELLHAYIKQHCSRVSPSLEEFRSGAGWSLADVVAIYDGIESEGKKVGYISTSKEDFHRYWSKLQPHQRFCDEKISVEGRANLLFMGIPWFADKSIPVGVIRFLDSERAIIKEVKL